MKPHETIGLLLNLLNDLYKSGGELAQEVQDDEFAEALRQPGRCSTAA